MDGKKKTGDHSSNVAEKLLKTVLSFETLDFRRGIYVGAYRLNAYVLEPLVAVVKYFLRGFRSFHS